nr:3-hydroxyacyl-CoA dehydrogenase family protein [uncultured Pseudomonas sp.]
MTTTNDTPIKTVAVCGAGGTMGAGIAIVAARAGFRTLSFDRSEELLARSRTNTEAFFNKSVERGKMSQAQRDQVLADMCATTSLDDLADCDLVIEAVFEELSVKHRLLESLGKVVPQHCIIASNTSTLSITEIACAFPRPEKVVGMHFCLPAQLMKLIEMSPGILTSDATFQTAWQFTEACGQIPVKTQDKPGFILNALLVPFNNDAIRAVEAGVADAADIDNAIKTALGYKMGPLELIDLVGLDTQVRLCEAFYPITLDPRSSAPPLLRRMVAAGLLGRKSGRGFYNYEGSAMFGA